MTGGADVSSNRDRAWDEWTLGLRHDAVAWLCIMAWLFAYRCLIAWPEISTLPLEDSLRALLTGARFDSVIATIVVLPTIVIGGLSWLAGYRINLRPPRAILLWLFFVTSAMVYAGNYQFYQVMGTQLDQRVLAILSDDDGAVRTTVWQAHHPLWFLAIAIIMGAVAAFSTLVIVKRTRRGPPSGIRSKFGRIVMTICLVALVFGLVRGFAWGQSPIRIRTAYVSQSGELNRLIPSPFAFFLNALEDLSADRSAPSPAALAQALDIQDEALGRPPGTGTDIAQRLAREAPGAGAAPDHIFIILLEGQHGFPLMEKYRAWGFYPGLAKLADKGAWFDNVIPSGRQTDNTLGALVAGTLSPDFVILSESGAQRELPTSIAPHFRRLGYETHFFYGGYAGWQRLDEFVLPQGFQHLHSAGGMQGKPGNAWGVWDNHLFDDVLSRIDPSKPSFNFILTTNNHSPFNVDLSLLPPPPPLPPDARNWDEQTLMVLRHEMFVDREVKRFVSEASQRFPHSLFVITGDHAAYGANYQLPGDSPLELLTVPIIFAGDGLPTTLRGHYQRPASHLDIVPTIYDLIAPAGFVYAAFGENLLGTEKVDTGRHALGQDKVLLDGWLANTTDPQIDGILKGTDPPPKEIDFARRHHEAVREISRAMIFDRQEIAGD